MYRKQNNNNTDVGIICCWVPAIFSENSAVIKTMKKKAIQESNVARKISQGSQPACRIYGDHGQSSNIVYRFPK